MTTPRKFIRRPYEKQALVAARKVRQLILYWTRRGRKSTNLGAIVFDELSKEPGRMAVAASASLLLGKELVTVTLSQAEQAMIVSQEAEAMQAVFAGGAADKELDLQVANSDTGKIVKGISREDFSEMYRTSRLELRLYFDRTRYSRLQVIAPNPATARSWRALVIRDEVGYTAPQFETALQIATDAMMRDTPDLKMIYASNLCADDRHPFFTMTLPRDVTAPSEEEQFEAKPDGHFYIGQTGLLVHRVALKDAYAAGHQLFDDYGKPMTYDEARKFGPVKMGWDISYALNHKAGGAAVIDLMSLTVAAQRGIGKCLSEYCDGDADFAHAIAWLRDHLTPGLATGIGFDVATTTGGLSNPSSVTVTQRRGIELTQVLNVLWKTRDPKIARERVRRIVETCRAIGAPARGLAIDASNERYFAEETRQEFAALIPVHLVVSGDVVEPRPPGYDTEKGNVNYKTWTGDSYAAEINDNHYTLPPEAYFKKDHRQPVKNAGRYECEVDADGGHGDTFDSGKLAQFELTWLGGGLTSADGIHFQRSEALAL